MRKFIEIVLQQAGYEVVSAEDGLAAMERIAESEFDAIVSDAIMPNMSGYEMCRIMRLRAPEKRIPFVILSGLDEVSSDDRFCDAFLTKDTNLKEKLLQTLAALI